MRRDSEVIPAEDMPDPHGYGPYGWIVAAVTALAGSITTVLAVFRKGRREDTTTALGHANRIIANYKKLVDEKDCQLDDKDKRVSELEARISALAEQNREETDKLWARYGRAKEIERRARMRLEWVLGQAQAQNVEIKDWPFGNGLDGDDEKTPQPDGSGI
jgi:hypothetical protein